MIAALVAAIAAGVLGIALAYRIGFMVGRADMVNRLLDAKDNEAWNYAHFLRADIRASAKPAAGRHRVAQPAG